jgi:hypothetical protein
MASATSNDLTRFITIQKVDESSYDIVLKSFPKVEGDKVVFSCTSATLAAGGPNRASAETAAKLFAQAQKVPYVPEAASVITIAPVGSDVYMAMKVGNQISAISSTPQDLVQSVVDAIKSKKATGMHLVYPGWLKTDGSVLEYPKWASKV